MNSHVIAGSYLCFSQGFLKTMLILQARLRSLLFECAIHINENYEVEALCRSFPKRLQELVDNLADRLKR